jgi:tRNA-Thr(GGU) m(6)t(6)A37 methyltransferase TsaA
MNKNTQEITYKPIGIIHSEFKEPKGVPIQPTAAESIEGTIEIFSEYVKGLQDLENFSHIILIYQFHLSDGFSLKVTPYMDKELRGVFATRAPHRPNQIGLSIVHLIKIEGNTLHIRDVDIVDKTPLLDIKPYVPEFDHRKVSKIGWLKSNIHKLPQTKGDGRFS